MDRYCQNCGNKMISDAKFCSKCGSELVEINEELLNKDISDETEISKSNTNPVSIIVAVIGVIFLLIAIVTIIVLTVGVKKLNPGSEVAEIENTIDSEDNDDIDETIDENNNETTTESSDKKTFENSTKNVDELDRSIMKSLFETIAFSYENDQYISVYLLGSIAINTDYIGEYYECDVSSDYRVKMKLDDVNSILDNTIGKGKYSLADIGNDDGAYSYIKGDEIYMCMPDSGDYEFRCQLDSINSDSDGNIELIGYLQRECFTETWYQDVRIVLEPNSNSIWEGYAVTYVDESAVEHYYMPNVQIRVYYADEMNFTEEEYRRARNEIFARYGRRFQTPELQRYFDEQHWYNGYRDDVSMDELTDTERQTIKELDKYKDAMGY